MMNKRETRLHLVGEGKSPRTWRLMTDDGRVVRDVVGLAFYLNPESSRCQITAQIIPESFDVFFGPDEVTLRSLAGDYEN